MTASILIVEDEVIIAKAAEMSLESLGYQVVDCVVTGEEGIERARELRPDLVLMDIFLPGGIDGIEAAMAIRQELGAPVVFATALGDEETIERARKAEPFGFIIKPYDKSDLRSAIEMALYKSQADRLISENERWLSMIMSNMREAILTTDPAGVVLSANPVSRKYFNAPVKQKLTDLVQVRIDGDLDILARSVKEELELCGECILSTQKRDDLPADITFKPIHVEPNNELVGFLFSFNDISERKRHEKEREDLIAELRTALDNVKQLKGLVPICAQCKKVRDDLGYWKQVEEYITANSDAEITHGLCPECTKALYPELYKRREEKKRAKKT